MRSLLAWAEELRGASMVRRRERRGRFAALAPDPAHEEEGPERKQEKRPEPEEHRGRLERRPVEHEVAVAVHEVVDDLPLAPARLELLADLPAQVEREVGVGIGERLVLAYEAAQLLGERHHALF